MANMTKKIQIAFCLFGFGIALQAQLTVSTAGGNATGIDGTVSYTVGQVDYITNTSSNGKITQGVQQPFEILIVTGLEEAKNITLECTIFPNPASEFLKLKIENYQLKNLSYQLYDINGKLLENKKVDNYETTISMKNIEPSTYFLKVTNNKNEVKTFKIIKN